MMIDLEKNFTFEDALKKFVDYENLSSSEGENFPSEGTVNQSIRLARKDLMVRTLTLREDAGEFGNEGFADFKCKLEKYFNDEKKIPNQKAFNEWHYEACTCVRKVLNRYYKNVKYGKAQKLVNMTFKYLYCFAYLSGGTTYEKYENYFEYCHMPLDSVIFEWIKRKMKDKGNPKFKTSKIPSWSNMDYADPSNKDKLGSQYFSDGKYYTYNFFIEIINPLITDDVKTPLQAEFIIWPQMRLQLAAEAFLRELGESKQETLEKDLNRIREKLKQPEN